MNPRSFRYAIIMLALSVFAVTFASGCASMRASAARTAHIQKMTGQHVYDSPCEQVWPSARQLLFSEGFSVKDTGEGTNMTLETEWAYRGQGKNQSSVRYLVQGIEASEGQCEVNFSKNVRSSTDNRVSSSRDLDIEWKLLKTVDQETAQKIEQEAEIKAQAAANS